MHTESGHRIYLPKASEGIRGKLFTVRMTGEERERAERLASHYGITVASLIRMLFKDRERELDLVPKKAKARR